MYIYYSLHFNYHLSYFPQNKNEQFCQLSDNCMHDTVRICGTMGDQKRTFLDMCDLLEFACDTNQIYTHVDEMEGCPEEPNYPPKGFE
uniref:SFRICE_015833 n=1 Tax=Spodoptera frugiperda TaxID=7108 RepID=A0A2H1WS46_SPOFR